MRKYYYSFLVTLIFFVFYLITLNDYGISWDEPIHFLRGQAYLNLLLTGNIDFSNIPQNQLSYYQSDSLTAEYFIKNDSGHPPVNGIIASFFNLILFKTFGIFSDIHSYHVFNILTSGIIILIVSIFTTQVYGRLAGIIAGMVIGTYPLLVAESHFNIKDPPLTAFYTLTIWCFWMSLAKANWKWLLGAVFAFYLGFGTKFNMVFLPFILGPYLVIRYWTVFKQGVPFWTKSVLKINKKYLLVLALAPFIIVSLFIATWPYLWTDTLNHFLSVVGYYKEIGTGTDNVRFDIYKGFNSFPIIWIVTTTPPIVLVLTALGIFKILRGKGFANKTGYLWLLWLIMPIARVSVPNASIYGGIRQIMEFLPAMGIIAGVGGAFIIKFLLSFFNLKNNHRYFISIVLIIIIFLPHLLMLKNLHPNENVYFNSLIGGIKGAEKYQIPFRGNSFGNAYWQAIQWLNKNAELNSKVALVQGTGLNLPRIMLRKDIKYSNYFWSGIDRNGEYLMELTHNDNVNPYPYAWEYIGTFLEPVYEVKVDGFSIAKVWKNDLAHTKEAYKKNQVLFKNLKTKNENGIIHIFLNENVLLTQLVIKYKNVKCIGVKANVSVLTNNEWVEEPEELSISSQIPLNNPEKDENSYKLFLPARKGSEIKIESKSSSQCFTAYSDIEIYVLE